jgi:hypothetical protein
LVVAAAVVASVVAAAVVALVVTAAVVASVVAAAVVALVVAAAVVALVVVPLVVGALVVGAVVVGALVGDVVGDVVCAGAVTWASFMIVVPSGWLLESGVVSKNGANRAIVFVSAPTRITSPTPKPVVVPTTIFVSPMLEACINAVEAANAAVVSCVGAGVTEAAVGAAV